MELPALGLESVGNNDPAPHSVGAAELLYLHVSGLLSVRSVPFVGVGAFGKFEVFDWWCGCVGGVGDFARGWCKTWCWCLFGKRGDASLETFLRCGAMAGAGMSSGKSGGRSFHLGGGALAGAGVASPDEALPEPA